MTPAEVDAVLELWREVEGTEPPRMVFAGAGYFIRPGDGSVIHDDDASDLICGHLRRWLEARCDAVEQVTGPAPPCRVFLIQPGHRRTPASGDTLLLALIAAVRAVAGTTNTQTAADAAGETK